MFKVATVGDNCVDLYEDIGKAFPGGNPVNIAVYMKRLGVDASYIGVVGNDKYGDIIKKGLREKKVDISHLYSIEGDTALTKVKIINGDRVFGDYFEGVLANLKLSPNEINFLKSHDLVHSSLWGKVHKDLKEIKRGTLVSFDFADKLNSNIIYDTIPSVDYAFFSYIKDDEYIRNYMKLLKEKGPKLIITTLGENGSMVYDGLKFYKYGILEGEVVDTMGAGDSYIAGFLKGILEKSSIEECMYLGAKNASETIKYNGAW